MDFAFSEEQDLLRASARSWLAQRYPLHRVAELADSDTGWDPASWRELSELGWLDDDLGMLELAVLAEEAGYALLPAPWWSSIALAAPVLGAGPDRPTTLAWAEPGTPYLLDATATTSAAEDGTGWRLSGTKVRVPDLTMAEQVLVVASAPGGLGVWRVAAADAQIQPTSATDLTRRLATLTLDDVTAEQVCVPGAAEEALLAVHRRAGALLACEAVGIMQRALDLAAEHAKQRMQFGRPIGSYQAVSHPIADIYTALSLARSLAYRAAWAVDGAADGAADDVDEAVAVAHLSAGDGAVRACESAIQAMGGIGFTWDHPLHRFYKRAQAIAAFDGTARSRRAEIAAALLD